MSTEVPSVTYIFSQKALVWHTSTQSTSVIHTWTHKYKCDTCMNTQSPSVTYMSTQSLCSQLIVCKVRSDSQKNWRNGKSSGLFAPCPTRDPVRTICFFFSVDKGILCSAFLSVVALRLSQYCVGIQSLTLLTDSWSCWHDSLDTAEYVSHILLVHMWLRFGV